MSNEAKLPVTCPNCQTVHDVPFEEFKTGNVIECPCGARITIRNDDLSKFKEALDRMFKPRR